MHDAGFIDTSVGIWLLNPGHRYDIHLKGIFPVYYHIMDSV